MFVSLHDVTQILLGDVIVYESDSRTFYCRKLTVLTERGSVTVDLFSDSEESLNEIVPCEGSKPAQ